MNKKNNSPISVTIDHVVPRLIDIQITLFGFSYSVSLDNVDKSVYRLIDTSNGIVMATFSNYNQCVHYAEENDYEVICSSNLDLDF